MAYIGLTSTAINMVIALIFLCIKVIQIHLRHFCGCYTPTICLQVYPIQHPILESFNSLIIFQISHSINEPITIHCWQTRKETK